MQFLLKHANASPVGFLIGLLIGAISAAITGLIVITSYTLSPYKDGYNAGYFNGKRDAVLARVQVLVDKKVLYDSTLTTPLSGRKK